MGLGAGCTNRHCDPNPAKLWWFTVICVRAHQRPTGKLEYRYLYYHPRIRITLTQEKINIPFYIWYSDVASEDTYRRLPTMSPKMRYQVERACAVTGYATLYGELDLLSDPCVSENAQEASNANEGSRQIFELIMVTHGVMDNYKLMVDVE